MLFKLKVKEDNKIEELESKIRKLENMVEGSERKILSLRKFLISQGVIEEKLDYVAGDYMTCLFGGDNNAWKLRNEIEALKRYLKIDFIDEEIKPEKVYGYMKEKNNAV